MSPSILSAIGRAGPAIQNTLTEMEERPRREEAWGMQKEQFGQQRAIADLKINQMKYEQEERQKQEEQLKRPWDMNLDPVFAGLEDEDRSKMIQFAQKGGLVDERGVGTMRNRQMLVGFFSQNSEAMKTFSAMKEKTLYGAAEKALEDYQRISSDPNADPEKLDKAKKTMMGTQERLALFRDKTGKAYQSIRGAEEFKKQYQALLESPEWQSATDEQKMAIKAISMEALASGTYTGWAAGVTKILGPQKENLSSEEKKMESFEQVYPEYRGKRGTPEYAKAWDKYRTQEESKLKIGIETREAFGRTRGVSMYDTQSESFIEMPWDEIRKANKEEPGRYIPSTQALPTMQKQATLKEISTASDITRNALKGLRKDFDNTQRAQFAKVLSDPVPMSAFDAFLRGSVGRTLTDDQVEYMRSVLNLRESAFALRSVAGMGQGSDMLRTAIANAIPGAATFSKKEALSALDKFDIQVNVLRTGVPGKDITSRPQGPTSQDTRTVSPISKKAWVTKAKAMNKGVSDADLEAEFDRKYREK